jgi:hypothetical protein
MVIAHHIILTGYGHWLPNDPRGSMSHEVHAPRIAELGPLHYGRKEVQPSRSELRAFHHGAKERLYHPVLWWDDAGRQALADAIGGVVVREKLTCYACSVLRDHVHLLVRKHRLKAQQMSEAFRAAGREQLVRLGMAGDDHPVFSADPCHLFKSSPQEVRSCVRYIHDNYVKHRLAPVQASWVVPYDGWPQREGNP